MHHRARLMAGPGGAAISDMVLLAKCDLNLTLTRSRTRASTQNPTSWTRTRSASHPDNGLTPDHERPLQGPSEVPTYHDADAAAACAAAERLSIPFTIW
jgi:hypothetical protein